MLKKIKKRINFETVLTAIMALIIAGTLFIKPVIGMGDNGDFNRAMQPNRLYYPVEEYNENHFWYFNRIYGIMQYEQKDVISYFSTQNVLIKLAVIIDEIFIHNKTFDIRFLSLIYSLIFLAAVYIIAKYNKPHKIIDKCIFLAVMIFIFCDVGYLAYFNSLYGEPVSFIFLFMTIAALSILIKKDNPKIVHIVFYGFSAVMFIGAKQQNSVLGVLLAVMALRYLPVRKQYVWRAFVISAAVVMLIMSALVYKAVSPEIKYINQYHTITVGILKDSLSPEKDLEELGIDPKFSILKGTSYYDPHPVILPYSDVMIKEFYSKYSFINIAMFYIRHPDRLCSVLENISVNAYNIRPGYLGNYEIETGKKSGAMAKIFCFWSDFKAYNLPHTLRFTVVFNIGFFISSMSIYLLRRKNKLLCRRIEILWLVWSIGILQFAASFIGAGEADIGKHLFLYDVCFDIIFGTSVYYIMCFILNLIINSRKGRV